MRLGPQDRGILKENMRADLVLFDETEVADKSTFLDPHQYAQGIYWVVVNGVPVVQDQITYRKASWKVFEAIVSSVKLFVEPARGIEPTTYGLRNRCSAVELRRLKNLERETGFEPATLGLGSRCSTTKLLSLTAY